MARFTFVRQACIALLTIASITAPVSGQVIGLKTVPLAAGDQFLIFPSQNIGMGGTSFALRDPLADPFGNPAAGVRLTGSRLFSVPTFYSVSDENGGARTMPVGIHLRSEDWFGGGMVALQDVDQGRAASNWNWLPPLDGTFSLPNPNLLAERSATNRFAQLFLGRELTDTWSIGASALLVGINATDGVEQLYANAWDIVEHGSVTDYRIGLVGRLPGDRTVEVTLVRSHAEMTQEVTSVEWELTDSMMWLWTPTVDEEDHRNITKTWGAQVSYLQPLEAAGWTVGGSLTINRKDHPKIPTYDLVAVQNAERPPIPRDPGNSWAFVIGAGLAYEEGPTTFALDVAYEPAVSDTWADELVDVTAADGSVIPAGGHTVDNHFEFANASARLGLDQQIAESWTVQLGVRMRSYSYRMEQEDYVLGLERSLTQQWTEWTPSWGVSYDLGGIDLRYIGMASAAGHFPFPGPGGDELWINAAVPEGDQLLGGDILAPPAGGLATPDQTTLTHRLQISLPIR